MDLVTHAPNCLLVIAPVASCFFHCAPFCLVYFVSINGNSSILLQWRLSHSPRCEILNRQGYLLGTVTWAKFLPDFWVIFGACLGLCIWSEALSRCALANCNPVKRNTRILFPCICVPQMSACHAWMAHRAACK